MKEMITPGELCTSLLCFIVITNIIMQCNSSMHSLFTVEHSLISSTLVFPFSALEARNFLDRFSKNARIKFPENAANGSRVVGRKIAKSGSLASAPKPYVVDYSSCFC
jgi:hypothetical protein